jgi:hypothetical protein
VERIFGDASGLLELNVVTYTLSEAKKHLKHAKTLAGVNPHSSFFKNVVRWHELYIQGLKDGLSRRDAALLARRETGYYPQEE